MRQLLLTTSVTRLGQETGDTLNGEDIYGPIDTQAIHKQDSAQTVADSYAWFADEAFWSHECDRSTASANGCLVPLVRD